MAIKLNTHSKLVCNAKPITAEDGFGVKCATPKSAELIRTLISRLSRFLPTQVQPVGCKSSYLGIL